MKDFITVELLKELGFKLESYKESTWNKGVFYGVAKDIRTNGMTQLQWATDGHSCTYFGDKLPENISLCIKKDGGTRTAFSGYVFNDEEFRKVLQLTW